MKAIFSAMTLVLALTSVTTAHAADRKLGNVVAVERTVEDVYQTCVDQLKDHKGDTPFASCKFDVKKTNADFTQGMNRVLGLFKNGCEVEGYVQNGAILVTFLANGDNATLSDSKACLRKAIDASVNGDKFKFIVFTVE